MGNVGSETGPRNVATEKSTYKASVNVVSVQYSGSTESTINIGIRSVLPVGQALKA